MQQLALVIMAVPRPVTRSTEPQAECQSLALAVLRRVTLGRPGLAGALGRSGRGAPKSGAPGWGAGRCKISGALTFKTGRAIIGIEPSFSSVLG